MEAIVYNYMYVDLKDGEHTLVLIITGCHHHVASIFISHWRL